MGVPSNISNYWKFPTLDIISSKEKIMRELPHSAILFIIIFYISWEP